MSICLIYILYIYTIFVCILNFLFCVHIRLCLHHFKYNGKRKIVRDQNFPKKASTLPAKLQPPNSYSHRISTATDTYSGKLYENLSFALNITLFLINPGDMCIKL